MDGTERPARGNRARLAALAAVYAVVAAVGAFAFIVSYSHIYDLGRAHAQAGTAARLLPLSVDGLIVAATLVLFIQGEYGRARDWRARWMPRLTLYAAIAATVLANVAYGLPSGWLSAVLSGWPGAAFVAAVEIGVVVVRLTGRDVSETYNSGAVSAGKPPVPASALHAATMAYAASVDAEHPLPERQLVVRFGITRAQAAKIRGQGGASAATRSARSLAPALATQDPRPGRARPRAPAAPAGAALNGDGRG